MRRAPQAIPKSNGTSVLADTILSSSVIPQGNNPFLHDPQVRRPRSSSGADIADQTNTTNGNRKRLADTKPIFQHAQVPVELKQPIICMACAGRLVVLALEGNILLRRDLTDDSSTELKCGGKVENLFVDPYGKHIIVRQRGGETVYLSRKGRKFRNVNRLKNHRLSCVAWNYAVSYPAADGPTTSTGAILLGTETGEVFETMLTISNESAGSNVAGVSLSYQSSSLEVYWKKVASLDGAHIRGISIGQFESPADKYFILVATASHLYQFVGHIPVSIASITHAEPLLSSLFFFDEEKNIPRRTEFPGVPQRSELQAYRHEISACPSVYAWLVESGIYFAQVNKNGQDVGSSTDPHLEILRRKKLYKLSRNEEFPVGLVVTAFHIIALFERFARIISTITNELIQEDTYSDTLLGICRDELNEGAVFAYSRDRVYRYKIDNEARDVWQIYMDRDDLQLAEKYAAGNEEHMDAVLTKKAQKAYQRGDYINSASLFARTRASFEEVALLFTDIRDDQQPLKTFLREKLQQLQPSHEYVTQIFLIISWLGQIYLNELSQIRISSSKPGGIANGGENAETSSIISDNASTNSSPLSKNRSTVGGIPKNITTRGNSPLPVALTKLNDESTKSDEKYKALRAEFRSLISSPNVLPCLRDYPENREAFYTIVTAFGSSDDVIVFAEAVQDYEKVVGMYMQAAKFRQALLTLSKLNSSRATFEKFHVAEMFYSYSGELMRALPRETVREWKQADRKLDPARLLHALVQSTGVENVSVDLHKKNSLTNDDSIIALTAEQKIPTNAEMSAGRKLIIGNACSYLRHCIEKLGPVHDNAVHSYLLTLYCQKRDAEDDILSYLNIAFDVQELRRISSEQKIALNNLLPFDINYTLRLCLDFAQWKAAVKLYEILSLYDDAVDVALTKVGGDVGVQLAKDLAHEVDDREIRRRLWLTIARHVITNRPHDVAAATSLLGESDNLIRIEDVLPFFPAFDTIDEFKGAICDSLEQYNGHIARLKAEMEVATKSAELIRNEIGEFRNRYTVVSAVDGCEKCGAQLLGRKFYVFATCKHFFHAECLMAHVEPLLSRAKLEKLRELQRSEEVMMSGGGKGYNADDNQSVHSSSTVSISAAISKRDQIRNSVDDIIAAECPFCGEFAVQIVDEAFFPDNEYEQMLKSWQ